MSFPKIALITSLVFVIGGIILFIVLLSKPETPINQRLIPSIGSGEFFRDRLPDGSQGPEMVWINGGEFRMGDIQEDGNYDEKPVHSVSVARFAIGRYEVTAGEFRKFVKATKYRTDAEKYSRCYSWVSSSTEKDRHNPNISKTDSLPVVCVSWNDVMAYVEWLSQQTGHTYRLPTEAQWEYAARAGSTTSRYWGDDPDEACHYANVHDNTSKQELGFRWTNHSCTDGYAQTAPAGSFQPNAFDLFDMLGNVWEWTCSEYEDRYTGKEQHCVNSTNTILAIRGGAWDDGPDFVRSAYRFGNSPGYRGNYVGFRLAMLID